MTALVYLAGRVWIYPCDPREELIQGCVAVIADPGGSIAVDAGNCPAANPLLESSYTARARAMRTWEGFTVVPPQRTFTETLDLPSGVRLRHVGGNHAVDSLVVEVLDSGVLLFGDSFYPPPWHLRGPDDGHDLALVQHLLSDRFDWYVDSHSDPHQRREVEQVLGLG